MRSTLTVTTANNNKALTTLVRVKSELGITATTYDTLLTSKISEASSDIEGHCGRIFRKETLTQHFWGQSSRVGALVLGRYPVVSVSSVTVDGEVLDEDDYRLDSAGLLYRLSDGTDVGWSIGKSAEVVFVAGYVMPAEANPDLPPALEAACVDLVSSYWSSRGRDPNVREEDIPGVLRKVYWVGAIGQAGELPPSVEAKIAPFRSVVVG